MHLPVLSYCVENGRMKTSCLKSRLINERYLKNECEQCGINGMYNNKPIVLEMDHILENLRILCTNCHSQTDTYKSKNMIKRVICEHALIIRKNKYCDKCAPKKLCVNSRL